MRAASKRHTRKARRYTNAEQIACKIVSSANKGPTACAQAGSLRADLYYRLSVIRLFVPPLRERPEDIGPLTEFFVKRGSSIQGKIEHCILRCILRPSVI
jgi:arginine utilization regulatory protein